MIPLGGPSVDEILRELRASGPIPVSGGAVVDAVAEAPDHPVARLATVLFVEAAGAGASHLRLTTGPKGLRVEQRHGSAWSDRPLPAWLTTSEPIASQLQTVWILRLEPYRGSPAPMGSGSFVVGDPFTGAPRIDFRWLRVRAPEDRIVHVFAVLRVRPDAAVRASPRVIAVWTEVERLREEAQAQLGADRVEEGRALLDRAIAIASAVADVDGGPLRVALLGAALALDAIFREADALPLLERALALDVPETEPYDIHSCFGEVYEGLGRHEDAERHRVAAHDQLTARYGAGDIFAIDAAELLGRHHVFVNHGVAGAPILERAVAMHELLVGPCSSHASLYLARAEAWIQSGRLGEARAELMRLREAHDPERGAAWLAEPVAAAHIQRMLGLVEHAEGRFDVAAEHLRRARARVEHADRSGLLLARIGEELARVCRDMGRTREAEALLADAEARVRRLRAPGHPQLAALEAELARLGPRSGPYR